MPRVFPGTRSLNRAPDGNAGLVSAAATLSKTIDLRHIDRWRGVLLALTAVRGILGIVAIPLAPFLYREHAAVLVLLRPTKEVLLFAGFLLADHRISLLALVLASLPLMVGGAWLFFLLGHAYDDEIRDTDLPGIAGRILPTKRIRRLTDAVEDGGAPLVVLGRFASFPSSLVAAAAGAGAMHARQFFPADLAGALGSLALTVTAGFLLEEARDQAGPWLTVLGVLALAGMAVILGKRLQSRGAS